MYIGKHFELLSKSFDGDKKKFIERHQSIFDVAENLRHFIKPIIFIQFSTYAVKLCVNVFVGLQSGSWVQPASISGVIFVQLLQFCFGAQYLMDKSSAVARQFYESDKDLLLIIAKAQKPFVFRAWFYEANLEFVTLVLNSTLSLLAVLKNFV